MRNYSLCDYLRHLSINDYLMSSWQSSGGVRSKTLQSRAQYKTRCKDKDGRCVCTGLTSTGLASSRQPNKRHTFVSESHLCRNH